MQNRYHSWCVQQWDRNYHRTGAFRPWLQSSQSSARWQHHKQFMGPVVRVGHDRLGFLHNSSSAHVMQTLSWRPTSHCTTGNSDDAGEAVPVLSRGTVLPNSERGCQYTLNYCPVELYHQRLTDTKRPQTSKEVGLEPPLSPAHNLIDIDFPLEVGW